MIRDMELHSTCEHDWCDLERGLSKDSPDITIIYFYCTKCLSIRHKVLNTGDMKVDPEVLRDYGEDYGSTSTNA